MDGGLREAIDASKTHSSCGECIGEQEPSSTTLWLGM